MAQVKLDEARTRLSELIAAARCGDEVVITEDDQPVARLVAIETPSKPRPRFGSAKGLIIIKDDFDAPLEDFSEYMP